MATSRALAADEAHDPPSEAVLISLYETVAARRCAYDALLWQIPALSLTAQAFLFTAVLAPGSSRNAQIIASSLALVVSAGSLVAFRRFRMGERTDSELAQRLEEALGASSIVGVEPHEFVVTRAEKVVGGKHSRLSRIRPAPTWQFVLLAFLFAALALLTSAVFDLDLVASPVVD